MFGCGFFLINVALALHIIPMARTVVIADRYIYLSCIGLFFIMATQSFELYLKFTISWRRALIVGWGVYLCYLISYTIYYSYDWK